MDRILKWLPTIAGVVLFLIGLIQKIAERPQGYDQFITGKSYILIVIGIEAVLLNFAFNYILKENEQK